jgi:hypothetical protein
MYKIPESFDFSHFKGKALNQVSFGQNVVIFFFSNDIYIQWSGRFSVFMGNAKIEFNEVFPVKNDFGLLSLLEKKVLNIYTDKTRSSLFIVFEDDCILEIYSDDSFESFTLYTNGIQVIV